jgi:hypothetical protein
MPPARSTLAYTAGDQAPDAPALSDDLQLAMRRIAEQADVPAR